MQTFFSREFLHFLCRAGLSINNVPSTDQGCSNGDANKTRGTVGNDKNER